MDIVNLLELHIIGRVHFYLNIFRLFPTIYKYPIYTIDFFNDVLVIVVMNFFKGISQLHILFADFYVFFLNQKRMFLSVFKRKHKAYDEG